jgi:hypothetical protein
VLFLSNNAGEVDLVVDVVGWFSRADTPSNPTGLPLHSLPPARLLDTRDGTGAPTARVGAGQTLDLAVAGHGGVPATGAQAVVVNLTGVAPSADTHVTAWAHGDSMPPTSNLNLPAIETRAGLAIVPVGADGSISLFNNAGDIDLVADVVGWYGNDGSVGGGTRAIAPTRRVLDTRTGQGVPSAGRVGPGGVIELSVSSFGPVGFSADVPPKAIVLNVTDVQPTERTHITVWPDGAPPTASNLNLPAGKTVANAVIVPVGADGKIRFRNNSGDVDLLADLQAWID